VLVTHAGFGTLEHFLCELDSDGNGTVARGIARAGSLIQKSVLFQATCRSP